MKRLIPLAALCGCLVASAWAETFDAKVIAVMDGDTIMVLRDGQPTKIRLANIDAPEKAQAYGDQSRASLLEMVERKTVRIASQAVDQYGRIVGLVSADGRNVNQEQLKRGMAWEYSHFHSDKTYIGLQNEAQQTRRGLWAQADPQAPWLWRKQHPSMETPPAAPTALADTTCGNKHLCAQMRSCDEAVFYLTRCGVKSLDRNRDGVPCETICGGRQ